METAFVNTSVTVGDVGIDTGPVAGVGVGIGRPVLRLCDSVLSRQ